MIAPSYHLASIVSLIIFYEYSVLEMSVGYGGIKRYC